MALYKQRPSCDAAAVVATQGAECLRLICRPGHSPPSAHSPACRHWLYLEYVVPVKATEVHIVETRNLRFVSSVALVDTENRQRTVWQGEDDSTCPGTLKVTIPKGTSYR